MVNGIEMDREAKDQDVQHDFDRTEQDHEGVEDELEDDTTTGHSGSGSIVSITGQVNEVLTEYPGDVTTTVIGMVQNGMDGNILPPVGDSSSQRSERPPKQRYTIWYAKWRDESHTKTATVCVPQTLTDDKLPTVNVCETKTAPSWA